MPLCAALRLDRPPARPAQRTEQPLEHRRVPVAQGHLRPFPPAPTGLSPISEVPRAQVDTQLGTPPNPQKGQANVSRWPTRQGIAPPSRAGRKSFSSRCRRFFGMRWARNVIHPVRQPASRASNRRGPSRQPPARYDWCKPCGRSLVRSDTAARVGQFRRRPAIAINMGCDLAAAASSSTGTSWRIADWPRSGAPALGP